MPTYAEKVRMLMENGRFHEAREELEEALGLPPDIIVSTRSTLFALKGWHVYVTGGEKTDHAALRYGEMSLELDPGELLAKLLVEQVRDHHHGPDELMGPKEREVSFYTAAMQENTASRREHPQSEELKRSFAQLEHRHADVAATLPPLPIAHRH